MCHLHAASNLQAAWQEASPLLPEMILRLRWSVVNPKRQRLASNQTVVAARFGIPPAVAALVIFWSSHWRKSDGSLIVVRRARAPVAKARAGMVCCSTASAAQTPETL